MSVKAAIKKFWGKKLKKMALEERNDLRILLDSWRKDIYARDKQPAPEADKKEGHQQILYDEVADQFRINTCTKLAGLKLDPWSKSELREFDIERKTKEGQIAFIQAIFTIIKYLRKNRGFGKYAPNCDFVVEYVSWVVTLLFHLGIPPSAHYLFICNVSSDAIQYVVKHQKLPDEMFAANIEIPYDCSDILAMRILHQLERIGVDDLFFVNIKNSH